MRTGSLDMLRGLNTAEKLGVTAEAADKTLLDAVLSPGGSYHQAVIRHELLPTPCLELKQPGSS